MSTMQKTWFRKLISERFGTMQDFGAVTAGHGCSGSCGIAATSGYRTVEYHSAFDEGIHSVGRSTTDPDTSLLEEGEC